MGHTRHSHGAPARDWCARCGKIWYAKRRAAKDDAILRRGKFGTTFYVYRCPGDGYHLTTQVQ